MKLDKGVIVTRKGKLTNQKTYKKKGDKIKDKTPKEKATYILENHETPIPIVYQGTSLDDINYQFNLTIEYKRNDEQFIESLETDILTVKDVSYSCSNRLAGPLSSLLTQKNYNDFFSIDTELEIEATIDETLGKYLKNRGMLMKEHPFYFSVISNPNPLGEKIEELEERIRASEETTQAANKEIQKLYDKIETTKKEAKKSKPQPKNKKNIQIDDEAVRQCLYFDTKNEHSSELRQLYKVNLIGG